MARSVSLQTLKWAVLCLLLILLPKASPETKVDSSSSSASFEGHVHVGGSAVPQQKRWPKLTFSWRVVAGSVIGFVGAALGSVGGVGGGGIFVPDLNLLFQFDIKSSSALSQCMIMGATASNVIGSLKLKNPTSNQPVIDYDIALLIQPMVLLGSSIGVALSMVLTASLIKILLTVFFLVISLRSCLKGVQAWNQETFLQAERRQRSAIVQYRDGTVRYRSLTSSNSSVEAAAMNSESFNMQWDKLILIVIVLGIFLALQIFQNTTQRCGFWFWVSGGLQILAGLTASGYQILRLQRYATDAEDLWSERADWTTQKLLSCAGSGIAAGTVGGLFGMGVGFIMGPVIIRMGLQPQVTTATTTLLMLLSSVISVLEDYYLHRFPLSYASYLMVISILAALWGHNIVRKVVGMLGRTSLIIFFLCAVVFASALAIGGKEIALSVMGRAENLNLLPFCERD